MQTPSIGTIESSKKCRQCSVEFQIFEQDSLFYERLGVPPPHLCPECRSRRRISQLNMIHLFKQSCDATGKSIVCNYPPESPYTVYDQEYWYSDEFDGCVYARDFDFQRPFFEQFHELKLQVPRPALFTDYLKDENSAYTNYAGRNKDCYLIFDSDENRDCYYSYGMNCSINSCDCYRIDKLELCYEVVDSAGCYACAFVYNSENCSESLFLNNCIGCKNCILCSNLRQKQFHVNNMPVSPEEYHSLKEEIGGYDALSKKIVEFDLFRRKFPQKYMRGVENENVVGNYVVHSKNAFHCYDSRNVWDVRYCNQAFLPLKDCVDVDVCGEGELLFECTNLGYNAYNLKFSLECLNQVTNLTYCNFCMNGCSDLFGCVGLKRKQFCVLNKSYSKDDYIEIVKRIILHMQETGEWGENFPAWTSSFPYNLTLGQEIYPLVKQDALDLGYTWRDFEKIDEHVSKSALPDDIRDVTDSFVKNLLVCEECRKSYKVIPQELKFLKQMNLPLPRTCFHCRHTARILKRNPRYVWARNCDQCKASLLTSFAPSRPETVYCEGCYAESLE